MSAEGHITHATVGRINVERGDGTVTIRLWAWSLGPEAVLTLGEAQTLIDRIEAAMLPRKPKFAPPPAEDHEDLA